MSGAPPGCLSDDELQALVDCALPAAQRAAAEEHLDVCAECREIVAELLRGQAAAPADRPEGRVGRYTVTGVVGRGAAAVVLRAHDPELDRDLALKLLVSRGPDPRAALAEARAMARVCHPNVVTVFDAGLHEGQVYVAMELVDGETLAAHLARAERRWREILALFLAAGEGLAAAHAAGVVHGDVKADNVLVGRDGRVRIGDFGLARLASSGEPALAPAGTPLYMAPELLRGEHADARSDQFAFCVALYRALFRAHPFGDPKVPLTGATLARALTDTEARRPADLRGAPVAVWRVLQQGLATDPAARHRDVAALLAALRSAARSPRRRALAIAGAALAALAFVASARPAPTRCGDGRLRPGVEECDDGNAIDGDGCSARCLACTGPGATLWTENGHCYTFHAALATRDEAQAACDGEGGHLVTYDLAAEQEFVSRTLAPAASPFWIGLAREPGGAFAWPTDAPLAMSYWAMGQPSAAADARCVEQLPTSAAPPNAVRRGWRAVACGERAPFVCEREGWQVEPSSGHAFAWIAERLTWDAAVARCRDRGGHLATLTSAAEADFVSLHGRQVAWLGGGDRAHPGAFAWITGEPFTFARFGPTQPDDDARPSDCLALGADGLWYDRACADRYAALCERE